MDRADESDRGQVPETMKLLPSVIIASALIVLSTQSFLAKPPAQKVLRGSIDQWASLCNAAGIKLTGANVDKVMLGTPAYFSGLRANDKILNCEVGDSTLKVTFERGGKRFGVTVPTHPAAIQPSGVIAAAKVRTAVSEAQALDRLKDYDVILFLDCSGSMSDRIASEKNIRKWDWARDRIKEFNSKYNQAASRPITLVLFSDKFTVMPNCTMSDIEKVFADRRPEGGTDLAPPLAEIVSERLLAIKQRPCIIAVLHDGLPSDVDQVEQILQSTANKLLSSERMQITFLQVGDDEAGASAMKVWDRVDAGSKDIVKAELFENVKTEGLARALAQALQPKVVVVAPPSVTKKK